MRENGVLTHESGGRLPFPVANCETNLPCCFQLLTVEAITVTENRQAGVSAVSAHVLLTSSLFALYNFLFKFLIHLTRVCTASRFSYEMIINMHSVYSVWQVSSAPETVLFFFSPKKNLWWNTPVYTPVCVVFGTWPEKKAPTGTNGTTGFLSRRFFTSVFSWFYLFCFTFKCTYLSTNSSNF